MNALPGPDGKPPLVGIVGHAGAYGRWLARFLERRMGLQVRGSDIADPGSPTPAELARQVDVLVFSVPIRRTVAVIESCIAHADGGEAGALWLDLTSIKQAPVAAMLGSRADVAGLHPMAAPPKIGTLEGRTLAVCRARVARWAPWLDALLAALRADCVEIAPAAHDRAMALVQGLVHASHLAQADVLRRCAAEAGGMPALHALRTVGHELDLTVTGRILAGNPAIYEDIQFGNPDVLPVLERLADATAALRDAVARGDEAARTTLRQRFLAEPAAWFGADALAARSHGFERMGYLQADLDAARFLSVYLPEDRPGSLRALLAVFERLGVNLASIHSSRTPEGELHFRIGLDRLPVSLALLRAEVEDAGIGRVLEARDDA
ncbi:prephenate dehydrogenase [Thermomonas mangrovi]|uniref:prephenate dehydrogenase n=1 Tax=Thermomonas mangrovi TaxID=2993316 RepID=UPI00230784F5|nr:prephenate dehydrogenase [Thermomonas mangrovi]